MLTLFIENDLFTLPLPFCSLTRKVIACTCDVSRNEVKISANATVSHCDVQGDESEWGGEKTSREKKRV